MIQKAEQSTRPFVPALRYRWLTQYYDLAVTLTTREAVFRKKLLAQAHLSERARVLDLACGTGTMAVMIKSHHSGTIVTGLDGDPEILALARDKARNTGLNIQFDEGLSCSMPYQPAEFDVVFSSLFFHHLGSRDKARTMEEVFRVLKPGGMFYICDWGRPANALFRLMFLFVRFLDGFAVTRDNVEGRLPSIVKSVGFSEVMVDSSLPTILGTLEFISATKPKN